MRANVFLFTPESPADIAQRSRHVRKVPCVDGSELARAFFTFCRIGRCSHVLEAILDGKKYLNPEDVPPPETRDLRRLRQGKAVPRAPTLRALVKWAQRCDSAEELGLQLHRRYQRRQAIKRARQADRDRRLLGQD